MTPPIRCDTCPAQIVEQAQSYHCHCEPEGRGNLLRLHLNSYIVPGDRHGLRPRDDSGVR